MRALLLLAGAALLPLPAAANPMPIEAAVALVAPAARGQGMQGPPWQWVGIGQPAIFSFLWAPVPALATLAPGAFVPGQVPGLQSTLRNNVESFQAATDRASGQAVLNWERSSVLNAGAYNGP